MSRFKKLSKSIWHCKYHIVWVPKYRLKILEGDVAIETGKCIRAFSAQPKCEVIEMNTEKDHVHRLVMIPPKVPASN